MPTESEWSAIIAESNTKRQSIAITHVDRETHHEYPLALEWRELESRFVDGSVKLYGDKAYADEMYLRELGSNASKGLVHDSLLRTIAQISKGTVGKSHTQCSPLIPHAVPVINMLKYADWTQAGIRSKLINAENECFQLAAPSGSGGAAAKFKRELMSKDLPSSIGSKASSDEDLYASTKEWLTSRKDKETEALIACRKRILKLRNEINYSRPFKLNKASVEEHRGKSAYLLSEAEDSYVKGCELLEQVAQSRGSSQAACQAIVMQAMNHTAVTTLPYDDYEPALSGTPGWAIRPETPE